MSEIERPSPDEDERAVIAFEGAASLAALLVREGFRCRRLSEPDAKPGDAKSPPRVVLLARRRSARTLAERVRELRARWPLVDVLVWAPDAPASLVRQLLHAGARDVVLEAGEPALLEQLRDALDAQRILPMVERLAQRRVRSSRFEGMLSRSHAMWDVFELCARVAPTDANVLICGETGTGKELLARALHRLSKRKGRFVAVNCSALPETLVESELFGHERGAFTGAVRSNPGIFRRAEGGTVLLDEIGDMPESAQQSLLRVIEERTIRPVGSSAELPLDVRIVAATHVPLEDSVAKGAFREDLFYRVDVIRLDVPALRERPEDVVYLFGHFTKSLAKHYGTERPEASEAFLAALTAYTWPGNVRELENFAERVVLRAKRTPLGAADFAQLVRPAEKPGGGFAAPGAAGIRAAAEPELDIELGLDEALRPVVARLERSYLEALLEKTGGRMQEAARLANLSRRTLQRKLAAHGIDKSRFRRR